MPIFLIGYMGCGKSTIGNNLSQIMKTQFTDLDNLIEQEIGLDVCNIFHQKGEHFFRKKEHYYLTSINYSQNMIVAVGGGTPCFFDNMHFMNNIGVTIYLKVSFEELVSRLQFNNSRPKLFNKKVNLQDLVKKQLIEREKYYLKSHYVIESDSISTEQVYQILK
ncbi:MAG: shikimate kinase [Flavobacteriales bacterium TMED191]|nr:MAG: shikimate kinase [Flavobacteriales bacterium TMED191]|tara:strand:+ start:518 stop:1009 length:492 start_codon:yes stop_codon:yes gene_type:complete